MTAKGGEIENLNLPWCTPWRVLEIDVGAVAVGH